MAETTLFTLERRAFLNTGTLALGGLFLPRPWLETQTAATKDAADGQMPATLQVSAFYAEAGNYKRDAHYVVGLLSTGQEQTDESALVKLRNSLNYRTKVTYNSTDKFKLAFCAAAFDYFMQTPSLQFSAKVFTWGGGTNELSFGKRSLEKIAFYNDLEGQLSSRPQKGVLKSHSPYGPSIFFKNSCATGVGHAVAPVNARLSNLLQLSGLLCGCILRDQKGPPESAIKASVLNSLKERLGIGVLSAGANVGGGKFKID